MRLSVSLRQLRRTKTIWKSLNEFDINECTRSYYFIVSVDRNVQKVNDKRFNFVWLDRL